MFFPYMLMLDVRWSATQVRVYTEGTPPSSAALAFQATWESQMSQTVSNASLGAPVSSVPSAESRLTFGHVTPLKYIVRAKPGAIYHQTP